MGVNSGFFFRKPLKLETDYSENLPFGALLWSNGCQLISATRKQRFIQNSADLLDLILLLVQKDVLTLMFI